MSEEIVNKVAASALVTLNLEELKAAGERVIYDIKQNLFQEIILKEKDFRTFIKTNDWSVNIRKIVAINSYANHVVFGNLEQLEQSL